MAIKEVVLGKAKITKVTSASLHGNGTSGSTANATKTVDISGLYDNYKNITADNIFIKMTGFSWTAKNATNPTTLSLSASISYDANTGIITFTNHGRSFTGQNAQAIIAADIYVIE